MDSRAGQITRIIEYDVFCTGAEQPPPDERMAGVSEPARSQAATRVDETQFLLAERLWPGLDALPTPANGLITVTRDAAVVITGVSSGRVTVTVEVRLSPPEQVDTDDWDEVIETDFLAGTGEVVVRALMDDPPSLPALTTRGPGTYRFRVHAAGRDLAPDEVAFEPVEKYLIQTWPVAAPQAEVVHKQTDSVGEHLRRYVATTAGSAEEPSPPRQSYGIAPKA